MTALDYFTCIYTARDSHTDNPNALLIDSVVVPMTITFFSGCKRNIFAFTLLGGIHFLTPRGLIMTNGWALV